MKDDGGPAFPYVSVLMFSSKSGMSLRDWFAGMALANVGPDYYADHRETVRHCFEVADAMLEARAQKEDK